MFVYLCGVLWWSGGNQLKGKGKKKSTENKGKGEKKNVNGYEKNGWCTFESLNWPSFQYILYQLLCRVGFGWLRP